MSTIGAATQEEQYLYGFLDPENGARGPGDASYSTFVVPHRSFSDYTVKTQNVDPKSGLNFLPLTNSATNQADQPGYLLGAANTTVYTDQAAYRKKETDSITFVASPHFPRAFLGATPFPGVYSAGGTTAVAPFVSHLNSGFCVSSNIMSQTPYSNQWYGADVGGGLQLFENEDGWCKPLAPFTPDVYVNPPEPRNVLTSQRYVNFMGLDRNHLAEANITDTVQRRLVGLKLQVTVNSNVFITQGQVVGGDTKTIYGTTRQTIMNDNMSWNMPGSIAAQVNDSVSDLEEVFGPTPTFRQSQKQLGMCMAGNTYEAVFLPTTDHICNWSKTPAVHSPLHFAQKDDTAQATTLVGPFNGTTNSTMTWSDYLLNNPACYLTFSGIPDGTTFRVMITASYEYIVLLDSPLSLVINSARMNNRFLPDWGKLGACSSASDMKNGTVYRNLTTSSMVRHGAAAAAGYVPRVVGDRPANNMVNQGASNGAMDAKAEVGPKAFGPQQNLHRVKADEDVATESLGSSFMRGAQYYGQKLATQAGYVGASVLGKAALNMGGAYMQYQTNRIRGNNAQRIAG